MHSESHSRAKRPFFGAGCTRAPQAHIRPGPTPPPTTHQTPSFPPQSSHLKARRHAPLVVRSRSGCGARGDRAWRGDPHAVLMQSACSHACGRVVGRPREHAADSPHATDEGRDSQLKCGHVWYVGSQFTKSASTVPARPVSLSCTRRGGESRGLRRVTCDLTCTSRCDLSGERT